MTVSQTRNPIVMEELVDSADEVDLALRRTEFDRNAAWLQAHAAEVYSRYRGKCICVAGQEVFVADTASEALAKGVAAHPQDRGRFVHYIPKDRMPRVYAN